MLVVIDKAWLAELNERSKLADSLDYVRVEVREALKRRETEGLRVIPVLVEGAVMPELSGLAPALQDELAALLEIQAQQLRDEQADWANQCESVSRKLAESPEVASCMLEPEIDFHKLLDAVGHAAVSDAVVKTAFMKALEGYPQLPAVDQAARSGTIAMVRHLADLQDKDAVRLRAVHRFVLVLIEELAGDDRKGALKTWLDGQRLSVDASKAATEFTQSLAFTGVNQTLQRPPCFLFIDLSLPIVDKVIGKLFIPGEKFGSKVEVPAMGTGAIDPRDLYALLQKAARVLDKHQLGSSDLILELGLSHQDLADEVERLEFIDDIDSRLVIGTRHMIIRRLPRRWSDVLRRKRLTELATKCSRRLQESGLNILWVDPQEILRDKASYHVDREQQVSCLGIGQPGARPGLEVDARNGLYSHDIPFACWATGAWSAADEQALQAAMQGARGDEALCRIFKLRQDAGFAEDHFASKLAFLWDDPNRIPYDKFPKPRR